ncbi:hypothetical protein [Flavivirga spongiicola]|uniref:Uncharacterized protein n=1 Tax=Flavivirga spongiicola TaxID=421621 RepID=A0ABU7Y104_9FLAO|nr:hypothetical protein [Flavivirga sp. MEBiC05379]MDO5980941.1 hypothetical protein [Flavivirga sp. MEBiC05379]
MKKLVLILLTVFTIQNTFTQNWIEGENWIEIALDKGIKIENNDSHELKNDTAIFPILLEKGEILINKEKGAEGKKLNHKDNQDYIIFNEDLLRFKVDQNRYKLIQQPNIDLYKKLLAKKHTIFKQEEEEKNNLEIDLSKVKKLLSDNNVSTKFYLIFHNDDNDDNDDIITFDKKHACISTSKIGYETRLFIPGFPSIFLNANDITKYKANIIVSVKDTLDNGDIIGINHPSNTWYRIKRSYLTQSNRKKDSTYSLEPNTLRNLSQTEKYTLAKSTFLNKNVYSYNNGTWGKTTELKLLNTVIIFVIIILIGLLIWFLLNKYFKHPIKKHYDNEGIKEFMETHNLSTKKFKKLNPIFKSYHFDSSENRSSNANILEKIEKEGNDLNIDYYYAFKPKRENNETPIGESESYNRITSELTIEKLENLLHQNTNSIIQEIRRQKNDEKQNITLEELRDKKKELESAETKIEGLEESLKDIKNQNEKLGSNLIESSKNLDLYKNQLVFVNTELQSIGKNYVELINHFKSAQKEIINFVNNKSLDINEKQGNLILSIMGNYPSNNFDDWLIFLNQLSKGKVFTDTTLSDTIIGHSDDDEKVRYLKIGAYKNLWEPYANAIFLQLEHLRVLSNITEPNQFSDDLQKRAITIINNLKKSLQDLANLKINYIPILSHYESETFTKVSSNTTNRIFKNTNVDSEHIVQVLSFGFKKVNGFENETTEVIIKN